MTAHEPGSRAPRDGQDPSVPVPEGDSTIEASPSGAAPGRNTGASGRESVRVRDEAPSVTSVPWAGGRIALVVATIGLLGTALGAIWFGVAERVGLNPGGVVGMGLVLVARYARARQARC